MALKILLITFFGLLFLVAAYFTRKAGSVVQVAGYIFLELIFFAGLIYGSIWIVSYNLKKAVMTNVKNTRILSREELVISGYVRNVGKYTIDNAYLKIKIIHGVSGQTRDILRNRDGSKKENTIVTTVTIAENLRIGEQRKFHAIIKYPPHFRLSDIITKLSWD